MNLLLTWTKWLDSPVAGISLLSLFNQLIEQNDKDLWVSRNLMGNIEREGIYTRGNTYRTLSIPEGMVV